MAAGRGAAACPVCWTAVGPDVRVCPSCRADLTGPRPAAAPPASPPHSRLVPQSRADAGRRRGRVGPWVTVAVAVAALLTAGTIKVVSGLLPPPAESGAATANVGTPERVTPSSAVNALLAFEPAGDVESVGVAIAYATRDAATLPTATTTRVRPGPGASQLVTVAVPVDVAFLLKVHAIETRLSPNLSNLGAGRLYVNAADDNAYGIVMNPRTHVAVFRFRLAADDRTIWPDNLNALQVISQTQSLG